MNPEDFGMKLYIEQLTELGTNLASSGEVKATVVGIFILNSHLQAGWKVVAHAHLRSGTYMFLLIKAKG